MREDNYINLGYNRMWKTCG